MTDREAMSLMLFAPARVGRLCGFPNLRDEVHGVWLREMLTGQGDMTLQAHRGSYKTTCLSLAVTLTMILRPRMNLMFFRKTDEDVAEVLRQVRLLLDTETLRVLSSALWGSPVRTVRSTQSELTCDCYSALRGASQLTGSGIGSSITGRHADLIFTDDIVNLRDRISAQERERTRGVYMELQNIRNPGGRIINTGTPWHPEDAFALMPPPRRWDCYSTGLIAPDRLDELRRSMSPSLFAANYELRHIAREDALFAAPPVFTEDPELLRDGICHVDAAYGGGDFTAMTCARRRGDRIFLYGRLWSGHADRALPEIGELCRELKCGPVYLETNGDKGYLSRSLWEMGMRTHPYRETMNKYVKIATVLRRCWDKIVFLRDTDPGYIRQILDYTASAEHDDAPDSAACACRIVGKGM